MSNRKKLCSLVSLVLMFTLSVTAYAAETNVPSGNFEISTAEVNGEEVELVHEIVRGFVLSSSYELLS